MSVNLLEIKIAIEANWKVSLYFYKNVLYPNLHAIKKGMKLMFVTRAHTKVCKFSSIEKPKLLASIVWYTTRNNYFHMKHFQLQMNCHPAL